jgi:hypothetical protein
MVNKLRDLHLHQEARDFDSGAFFPLPSPSLSSIAKPVSCFPLPARVHSRVHPLLTSLTAKPTIHLQHDQTSLQISLRGTIYTRGLRLYYMHLLPWDEHNDP